MRSFNINLESYQYLGGVERKVKAGHTSLLAAKALGMPAKGLAAATHISPSLRYIDSSIIVTDHPKVPGKVFYLFDTNGELVDRMRFLFKGSMIWVVDFNQFKVYCFVRPSAISSPNDELWAPPLPHVHSNGELKGWAFGAYEAHINRIGLSLGGFQDRYSSLLTLETVFAHWVPIPPEHMFPLNLPGFPGTIPDSKVYLTALGAYDFDRTWSNPPLTNLAELLDNLKKERASKPRVPFWSTLEEMV